VSRFDGEQDLVIALAVGVLIVVLALVLGYFR
jgi:hypothetical protein